MNVTKRSVLQKCREKIVADVEINDLIDDLTSKLVISLDDIEKIVAQNERKLRTRCFLDILSQKGNEEYDKFVNILNKDYPWLTKDLENEIGCITENEYEDQLYSEQLAFGEVPQLPVHYVSRTSELDEITQHLKLLKRGNYLVIHGVTGSGKSVLAVSAVRNNGILKKYFNNNIFFINAGEAKTTIDAANLLYRLYIKIENNYKTSAEFHPHETVFMKTALQKFFKLESQQDALLILDDVCSDSIIQWFNFGCKTLVTTQFSNLVSKEISKTVEINRGFKESETLQLFSNCLKRNIEDLPLESKKIHELCKGSPLVITLIASHLENWKDDALDRDRWKHYINMLIDKKDGRLTKAMQIFFRRRTEGKSKDYLANTIKHCILSLPKNYQEYYKNFAVFVEDVNITHKVLEIIWKKTKYEVEEIVNELKNKSLIVCAYNVELKSYVYGIHDLLLSHLKQILSKQEIVALHNKLIENYLEISNGDFTKFPRDNYIYTYIGYHLLEAERYDYFPILYFDLKFIGEKIKSIGVAGLVGDFKRYKKYITKNYDKLLCKKLKAIEFFVQKYGQNLHKFPDTDIVQYGLQQPTNSNVYDAAMIIARKECLNTLYLSTRIFGQTVYITHTLDLKEDVCATCFTHQTNIILVGNSSGEIHVWDHNYKIKLKTFASHTQKILYLELSQDAKQFLSVSEDGFVKVWSLEDIYLMYNDEICDENGFNIHTPPPSVYQKSWLNFFSATEKVDKCKTFSINNDNITAAKFSSNCEYLLIGTEKGIVKAWNLLTNEEMFFISCDGNCITSCTFSLNDLIVLFACENVILIYNFKNGEYISQFMNDVRTTSLLVIPNLENEIIAISDISVTLWSWKQKSVQHENICVYDIKKQVLDCRDDAQYICGAVTWDGFYLVVGSSDYCIRMWNIETTEKVKEINEHNGLVLCLDTFLNQESNSNVMYILLSGSDNKTVKQWHFQEMENLKQRTTKLLTTFATHWINQIPLIAALNSDNQIQIFSGHTLIAESKVFDQPKCLTVMPNGNEVAIGFNNGLIALYNYKNKIFNPVMDLESAIIYIECIEYSKDSQMYLLAAAADNCCLMLFNGLESIRLKKPEIKANIGKSEAFQTIKCIYLPSINRVLSIEDNGSVKLWHSASLEDVLIVKEPNSTITTYAISQNKDLIALSFSDKQFKIYELLIHCNNNAVCMFKQSKKLDDIPRSSCFSEDGQLLALGLDSGNIILWSLEDQVQISSLQLHTSWVRSLKFSPARDPVVLVSIGDQIAWWNISYVWNKYKQQSRRNSRGRRSFPKKLIIDTTTTSSILDDCWIGKEGKSYKKELFSSIKLEGEYAVDVSVSPNFNSFVIIDLSGLLYVMDVLKPSIMP